MCEILVRAVDGICDDPAANPLKGFPVTVQPDGHEWGRLERPPEYVVLQVPELDLETALAYVQRSVTTAAWPRLRRRRRWQIAAALVDQALAAGGTLVLTRATIQGNIADLG